MARIWGIRGYLPMAVAIFGLLLGLGVLAPPKAMTAAAKKVAKKVTVTIKNTMHSAPFAFSPNRLGV